MLLDCPRCEKGIVHNYKNVNSGICFKCNGTGKVKATKRKLIKETISEWIVTDPKLTAFAIKQKLSEKEAIIAKSMGAKVELISREVKKYITIKL